MIIQQKEESLFFYNARIEKGQLTCKLMLKIAFMTQKNVFSKGNILCYVIAAF
jgi:hypothetical protein